MGFVKEVAKAGLSPALALLTHKKKKPETPKVPSMISTSYERPGSMIGSPRGIY